MKKIRKKKRSKYPFCACGCGQRVTKSANKFILGHNRKHDQPANSGQFKKGQSGNPAGSPTGSRNRITLNAEALLQGEEQVLTRRLIQQAMNGNFPALKLCIERLVPVRKDVPVKITLPAVKKVADAGLLTETILSNISQGNITPVQGELLSRVIDKHIKTLQVTDLEARLVELEEKLLPV